MENTSGRRVEPDDASTRKMPPGRVNDSPTRKEEAAPNLKPPGPRDA
jgi:hypothetical protein